jgi:hypothetical protein
VRTDRATRHRLPWIIFGIQVGFAVYGTYLEGELSGEALFGLGFMSLALIGALIASRIPENKLGWVLLALVGFSATGYLSSQYSIQALLEDPGSLPRGEIAAWVSGWAWIPGTVLLITMVPLLFPDGRLPSPRWRWVARAVVVLMGCMVLTASFMPGPVQEFEDRQIPNPLGIDGAGSFEALFGVAFPVMAVLAILSTSSLFFRYRRAGTVQRQQLKYFAYAAFLTAMTVVVESAFGSILPSVVSEYGFLLGIFSISLGAGLAIFKYRLYDIDLVINRTLVYGALTAALAGIYLGLVFALQTVLPVETDSDLTIAASTLAVAALFRPLRARVQHFIDRRFYRSRYDAAMTLEGLHRRLRNEVDLDSLEEDVMTVVSETVRPAHAALWVRS